MIISANGIVLNEYSDVLLVQRDDTRTLAPPGGACEIDEFPHHAAVREVREETGLIVYPVRLVGLYYLPIHPNSYLFLCYRCIQRGGDLDTSAETPRSGFFRINPLPDPMLAIHKEQVKRAFSHSGGPPNWTDHQVYASLRAGNFLLNRLVYPWLRFRRSRLGEPEYVPPPDWKIKATLILSNSIGEIVLFQNESLGSWSLPASDVSRSEPPWLKANQLIQDTLNGNAVLNDLAGIYLKQGKPEMEFVFTGSFKERSMRSPHQLALFTPDLLPETLLPDHRAMVAEASESGLRTTYKLLH